MCPNWQISSRNLFHSGSSKWYCEAAVSKLDIAISLYDQNICGPCTVPLAFRKFPLLKIELLHIKLSSKPSKVYLTGGVLADLFNKTLMKLF